jgi:hypothetical protein
LEVQLTEQIFKNGPFVVFTRGIAGLANRHTQLRRVEGHMRNERRPPAGDGFDRPAHGFAVTDELIQIPCATRDLGDCPITDRCAEDRDIHLLEEVPEG